MLTVLKTGWRVMSEVHTAVWLLDILGVSAIPAVIALAIYKSLGPWGSVGVALVAGALVQVAMLVVLVYQQSKKHGRYVTKYRSIMTDLYAKETDVARWCNDGKNYTDHLAQKHAQEFVTLLGRTEAVFSEMKFTCSLDRVSIFRKHLFDDKALTYRPIELITVYHQFVALKESAEHEENRKFPSK